MLVIEAPLFFKQALDGLSLRCQVFHLLVFLSKLHFGFFKTRQQFFVFTRLLLKGLCFCVRCFKRFARTFHGVFDIWNRIGELRRARQALINAPLYFAKGLVMIVICCVVLGIAYGGVLTTMDLVGTRVLDDDYRRHGIKREGIVNSIMGFMNRLNGLFVSLATFLASRVYGYIDGNNPGTNPGGAGRFMMCLFPLICMVVAVVISRFVKFPEVDNE